MHKRNRTTKTRKGQSSNKSGLVPQRSGTLNRAPDNSSTVQIPRPISVRSSAQKRTFKTSFALATGAGVPIYAFTAMYAPFFISTTSGTSPTNASAPATFTAMLSVFGAYKVRRIQLIFEPLIPSGNATIVPLPFIVAMAPDVSAPSVGTQTALVLEDYPNSTKVSPYYPAELSYMIPKISAGEVLGEVLSGGWILSESYGTQSASGSIIVAQNTGSTPSTTYSQLSFVYEVWFKNPI